jgi:hypothetical protein
MGPYPQERLGHMDSPREQSAVVAIGVLSVGKRNILR